MVKKFYILLLLVTWIIFVVCNTNPKEPETKNDEEFNLLYFPLKSGNIWEYNVERNMHISTPPVSQTQHEGNEIWEIKNINLADSTIFLDCSFSGIKIESDSSTHVDTLKIHNSKVQITLQIKDSSLVKISDIGWPDNTSILAELMVLLGDKFKIIHPDKSDSVAVDEFEAGEYVSYTLIKGLGMSSLSIDHFNIFGSLSIKYKLIDAKIN